MSRARRGRRWRAVAAVGAISLLAACGSTVQQAGPAATAGDGGADVRAVVADDGLGIGGSGAGVTGSAGAGVAGPSVRATGGAGPTGAVGGSPGGGSAGGTGRAGGGATPSGAGAGQGSAPGAPAGAVAPGGAGGGDGAAAPGVTDSTIAIGILTLADGANDGLAAAGFSGVDFGDLQGNWRALLEEINATGGIAGREVVPVFQTVNIAEQNPSSAYQAACTRFTQDEPVFLVISDVTMNEVLVSCLGEQGVPLLYGAGGTLDDPGMAQWPHVRFVGAPTLSGFARAYADGLVDGGFFAQGTDPITGPAIGLIRTDDPFFERARREHLDPALAAAGLSIREEAVVTKIGNDGYLQELTTQSAAAVLRFRAAGITHVLFMSINATEPTLFMRAAEAQGYAPLYGLSTRNTVTTLQLVVSPEQLRGAMGVGWFPQADVAAAQDPGGLPGRDRCLEVYRDRGQPVTGRTAETIAVAQCDSASFARAVGDAAGPAPTQPGFLQAADGLGGTFPSAVTFATRFGPDRHAGAAESRTFAYDTACACFTYTSGPRPL